MFREAVALQLDGSAAQQLTVAQRDVFITVRVTLCGAKPPAAVATVNYDYYFVIMKYHADKSIGVTSKQVKHCV